MPCVQGLFRAESFTMKSPRSAGPLLFLLTAVTVVVVAYAPRNGHSSPSLANMAAPGGLSGDAATPSTFSRKACRFGQRYSAYYRRCVLWTPFDLG